MNNMNPIKTLRGSTRFIKKKRKKRKLSQSLFSKFLEIRKTKVDIYDIKQNKIVIIKTRNQMQKSWFEDTKVGI